MREKREPSEPFTLTLKFTKLVHTQIIAFEKNFFVTVDPIAPGLLKKNVKKQLLMSTNVIKKVII